MFVSNAPFLGSVSGAAQLRVAAVKLQNYADVNPGSVPAVLAFWEAQKALADVDHGLPYDGTYIAGVADVRPVAYKVLSHYRLFNKPGLADFKEFCDFFIEANGGVTEPLVFSKNLDGDNTTDAVGTYVTLGSAYNNSVAVTGGKAPYTYQWYRRSGGQDFTVGSNEPTYNIPSYASSNNGDYFVRVTDAKGTTIESTRDRVRVAVRLTTDLATTATWTEGTAASLKVVASEGLTSVPYTYAWFKDGVATGNTAASMNKSNPTAEDAGSYYCIVTSGNVNPPNTVQSKTCVVTVNPAA